MMDLLLEQVIYWINWTCDCGANLRSEFTQGQETLTCPVCDEPTPVTELLMDHAVIYPSGMN